MSSHDSNSAGQFTKVGAETPTTHTTTTTTTTTTATITTSDSTSIVIPSSLLTIGSTSNIIPSTYIFEPSPPLMQNDFETNLISPPTSIVQEQEQADTIFGSLHQPLTFSDLIPKTSQEFPTTTTNKITSVQPKIIDLPSSNAGSSDKDSTLKAVNIPPPPDMSHRISTSVSDFSPGPYVPPYIPPTSSMRTSMPSSTPATTATTTNINNTKKTSAKKDDRIELLYSPPPTSSPPLDTIPMSIGQPITTDTTTATMSSSSTTTISVTTGLANNKIPKISSKTAQAKTNYDSMELIPLQKKYRSIENQLKQLNKKRHDVEKKLNDMARSAHGKNIDLDPNFKNFKEDKIRYNMEIEQAAAALKKIDHTLEKKFNFRIVSNSNEINPLQKQQQTQSRRAKMSTGAKETHHESTVEKSSNNYSSESYKKLMLDFKDCKTWCEPCDQHYQTVLEYCEHLHKREHKLNTKNRSTPWRSHKEPLDKDKTYKLIKSICANVSNELNQNFTIEKLDQILMPDAAKDVCKAVSMARERRNYDKQDILFEPKGLNYLIPITGFYCTLCSKTLCDQVEVNLHLRSHEHNYAYVKCAALNQHAEQLLRTKYEKSYKKKFGTNPTNYTVNKTINIVKEVDNRATTSEELRGILKSAQRKNDREEGDNNDKFSNRKDKPTSRLPEMIPLSGSTYKPSSLKRLRTDSTEKALRDIIQPPSTNLDRAIDLAQIEENDSVNKIAGQQDKLEQRKDDTGDDSNDVIELPDYNQDSDYEDPLLTLETQYNSTIVIKAGDPDNPFPGWDLGICGNIHIDNLKDKRLKANSRVIIEKFEPDMYKDMLFDSESIWSRVNQLMTKKEPNLLESENSITEPTFFGSCGKNIPVDLENDYDPDAKKRKIIKSEPGSNDSKKQRRLIEKLSDPLGGDDNDDKTSYVNSMPRTQTDKDAVMIVEQVTKDKEDEDDDSKERDSISPLSGLPTSNEPTVTMNFLEDFFCEK